MGLIFEQKWGTSRALSHCRVEIVRVWTGSHCTGKKRCTDPVGTCPVQKVLQRNKDIPS
jgi:hypothetical protein